jgi:hypothetical protein
MAREMSKQEFFESQRKRQQSFLPQIQPNTSFRFLQDCKKAIDPKNIFGIKNGALDPGLSDSAKTFP